MESDTPLQAVAGLHVGETVWLSFPGVRAENRVLTEAVLLEYEEGQEEATLAVPSHPSLATREDEVTVTVEGCNLWFRAVLATSLTTGRPASWSGQLASFEGGSCPRLRSLLRSLYAGATPQPITWEVLSPSHALYPSSAGQGEGTVAVVVAGGAEAAVVQDASSEDQVYVIVYSEHRTETADVGMVQCQDAPSDTVEQQPGLARYMLRDAEVVATCGMDYLIRTWSTADFTLLQVFEGHTNFVNVVEPYHGNRLVSASDDNSLRIWLLGERRHGELMETIWVSFQGVKSLCVLPGHRAACGAADFFLRVVSLSSGEVLHKVDEHAVEGPGQSFLQYEGFGQVWSILHLRYRIMVTASDDTTLRVWDVDTMECMGVHTGHKGSSGNTDSRFVQEFAPVWKLVHLGDGNRIASGSSDCTILVWDFSDLEDVSILQSLNGHCNSVINLCLLAPTVLASCSGDCTVKVWDLEAGECIHTIETHGHPTCAARVDDARLAVGGGNATIRLYDWRRGADVLGKGGLYAHDFCISGMSCVRMDDAEGVPWLEPVVCRSTDPATMAWEQEFGPRFQQCMAEKAAEMQEDWWD